jgi:hypothetical protein
MPYIEQKRRRVLDIHPYAATTPGELNYIITKELVEPESIVVMEQRIEAYLGVYLAKGGKLSYSLLNEVVGALECARREYVYRMQASGDNAIVAMLRDVITTLYNGLVRPYEDNKIKENGDLEGYKRG